MLWKTNVRPGNHRNVHLYDGWCNWISSELDCRCQLEIGRNINVEKCRGCTSEITLLTPPVGYLLEKLLAWFSVGLQYRGSRLKLTVGCLQRCDKNKILPQGVLQLFDLILHHTYNISEDRWLTISINTRLLLVWKSNSLLGTGTVNLESGQHEINPKIRKVVSNLLTYIHVQAESQGTKSITRALDEMSRNFGCEVYVVSMQINQIRLLKWLLLSNPSPRFVANVCFHCDHVFIDSWVCRESSNEFFWCNHSAQSLRTSSPRIECSMWYMHAVSDICIYLKAEYVQYSNLKSISLIFSCYFRWPGK